VEIGPEMEFRQEQEVENPEEIEVSVTITCEGDLGAAIYLGNTGRCLAWTTKRKS